MLYLRSIGGHHVINMFVSELCVANVLIDSVVSELRVTNMLIDSVVSELYVTTMSIVPQSYMRQVFCDHICIRAVGAQFFIDVVPSDLSATVQIINTFASEL